MNKLTDFGLFGGGLVPVRSEVIVSRYNQCLEEMGIEKTSLNCFEIDGAGWSPEIAEERGDPFYLSHGLANPFAIIISPEQYSKPVYFPFHSFDRKMMAHVFENARHQITDITKDSAIWIDIDQEISHYHCAEDLLMVDSIVLRFFSLGRLMVAAREQRELVREFMQRSDICTVKTLAERVIESAKMSGDLRRRSIVIPDIAWSDVRSFYSRAFGGTFVFRDVIPQISVLILEDKSVFESSDLRYKKRYDGVERKLLTPALYEEALEWGLFSIDIEWCGEHIETLCDTRDSLAAIALSKDDPEADIISLNKAQYKRSIAHLANRGLLPDAYHELERFINLLKQGKIPDTGALSREAKLLVSTPARALDKTTRHVAWILLVKMREEDIVETYTYDKEGFFREYATWPENLQKWAVNLLTRRYVPYAIRGA